MAGRTVGRLLSVGLGAVCLVFAILGLSESARAATTTVRMFNTTFQPNTVNINVGDTVTWQNDDFLFHTTTSSTPLWDSGPLSQGQTFSFTFNSAGTFAYVCTIHFGMSGTVNVTNAGPTSTFTPTPTPTPVPPAVANVRVTTTRDGANRLLVTVAARPGQTLERLAWTVPANAVAETLSGDSLPTGLTLPAGTSTTTFRLRRVSGQSVHLSIVITGSFGSWRTFVGGGPAAW